MKELTRIKTVEITEIVTDYGSNIIEPNESARLTERQIKAFTHADDVKVVKVQDFIMDKE